MIYELSAAAIEVGEDCVWKTLLYKAQMLYNEHASCWCIRHAALRHPPVRSLKAAWYVRSQPRGENL